MSSTAIEESGVSAGEAAPARLKALFFLPSIDYYLVFESLLRAMLAAGHQVLVALDHDKGSLLPDKVHPFDALREQYPRFDYRQLPPRKDLWLIPASAIRRRLDYLRYLEPEYADQAGDRIPQSTWGLRALLFLPPFRWPFGRRLLVSLLRRLEAGMPIPRAVRSFVAEATPDVVVVSPLVEFGSAQGDYIRTAEAAGIPSVVVVEGGDDLTSKGGIRDVATLTLVRNETEADEAVRLHDLPRERIAVVGAESSNGHHAPAASAAVEAIERAAPTEVVRRREGRFLRPVLWLLTPLLAIVLPLVRPRATARAVIKAVRRLAGRIRKRVKTLRRNMKHRRAERRKAGAEAAKQEKLARAEAAKQQKLARAEAKGQGKARAEAARREKLARTKPAKQGDGAPAEPAKDGDEAGGEAETETERTGG